MQKSIHLILQGKGGVGKSLVASWLSQYFYSNRENKVKCIDTDPVNHTLTSYKSLNAEHLEILENSSIISRNFDHLMIKFFEDNYTHYVVDNGASSFIPLSNYLVENNAFEILSEAGIKIYIHSIITGGQALFETLSGFKSLADHTNNCSFIIWLNEYFGLIESDGKNFYDMKVYNENKSKILGTILIKRRTDDTFSRDIELMITNKMTFEDFNQSSAFNIMEKQRIKIVQREIFHQLSKLDF